MYVGYKINLDKCLYSNFLFSSRTEGYYKMHPREKMRTKYHFHRPGVDAFNTGKLGDGKQQKPQVLCFF